MGKYIEERNNTAIFECEYDKWKGKENVSSPMVYGMIYMLWDWLRNNTYTVETIDDVYCNTSGLRDGNRIDIHDNYVFDWDNPNLEITYIYTVNGTVWAVLYDKANDRYYGEFELPNP